MLEINSSSSAAQAVPNLLPCRVQFNGPVEPVQHFWGPGEAKDGAKVAYFRGRKLHGTALKLPEGYRGVVVVRKGDVKALATPEPEADAFGADQEQGQQEEQVPEGRLEAMARFEELMVWGHETTGDVCSDPFVRSMEEWPTLAEKIHSYSTDQGS